ncbi:MAG TPA: hypothetical protein VFF06_19085 [Polyangia bacterium]|nr:hypothetical protein [Polyangia bacterium]
MAPLALEEVDLHALADSIRHRLGEHLEANYLRGKTILRDAVAEQLACSDVEAEQLVETLELNGLVRFPQLADETHPATRRPWIIGDEET